MYGQTGVISTTFLWTHILTRNRFVFREPIFASKIQCFYRSYLKKNRHSGSPNRFQVITVGCENDAFEPEEKLTYPPPNRMGQHTRLSVPDFLAAVAPGRKRSSSYNVPDNLETNVSRKTSRANSVFSEIFKDSDLHLVDYDSEAAPRLESYRNSLTHHEYMTRPTLEALHESQQECRPVLTTGRGENTGAVKFGWIKGVYIRCLLNIWGVMLFLRMGWMTGQCGIILAIVIVLLSTVVTVITTLSMSAICTNGDVKGGGAYYLISRSLGPEFGGVVGILLFLANAVSGAMYIIGAGEAIRDILNEVHEGIVEFPSGVNDIRVSSIICLLLMMSITGIGMAFENKTQMVLLVILLVAMMDYFVGACFPPNDKQKAEGFLGWSVAVGLGNMGPDFRGETFFSVFAVFFPSVTGILAGANISGDLKDPCMAIPKGTLLSILTTSLSYILLILWLGFTTVRDASGHIGDLVNGTFPNCTFEACDYGLQNNYQVMKMASAFGPLIYAGIFAATLSSALVSIVSAPRILQASFLCVDGIIPWLNWFGKGYGKDNDPRRALALTFIIAVVFTVIGDLNAVAPIISNFFMAANGLINFSCFHASYVKSPGFRPGFRYYNLWLSLLGALLCVVIMFVMNWITALVTDVLVVALYIYIAKTCPEINWGSSFQGYSYQNALHYLNKLSRVEEHVKNYRPAILALTGNTSSRPQLVDFAGLVTKDVGLLICAHISKEPLKWTTRCLIQDLNSRWLQERRVKAFCNLVEADSFENGVSSLIQTVGVGKMRPNILLMGFKENWQTCEMRETLDYFHIIQ
ncbi:solute carrier family 12 member 2 [Caerostris extrusa]|uniref:Solute carrier family 12 member 2 n=1 Tax=Caerostris extrusa TaxID=172846 RepID=A0AAV4NXN2_CAEEX|nr:solute carrier family 12 member 2 [Caerostris extrusa]